MSLLSKSGGGWWVSYTHSTVGWKSLCAFLFLLLLEKLDRIEVEGFMLTVVRFKATYYVTAVCGYAICYDDDDDARWMMMIDKIR